LINAARNLSAFSVPIVPLRNATKEFKDWQPVLGVVPKTT
jgi:hypothetical protein